LSTNQLAVIFSHTKSVSAASQPYFSLTTNQHQLPDSQPYRTNETKGEMSASKRKGRVQKEKKKKKHRP